MSDVKTRSQPVARAHAADRVGRVLVTAPAVSAALDEQLRNFSLVEIFRDRELGGRPDRTEDKGDVLHFDQLARLVPGSPRHEAVVDTDQVDLATIDAALIVDHLHVGLLGQTGSREPGARTGIRHGLADLDLADRSPPARSGRPPTAPWRRSGAGCRTSAETRRSRIRRSGVEISDQRRRRGRARVPGGHAAAPPNKRAETKRDEITSFQWIGLQPAPGHAIRWPEMSQQVRALGPWPRPGPRRPSRGASAPASENARCTGVAFLQATRSDKIAAGSRERGPRKNGHGRNVMGRWKIWAGGKSWRRRRRWPRR